MGFKLGIACKIKRNKESLKNVKNDKIENVADSV
jgi:hypothetical protein